jgi:hypothetical protein
MHPNQQRKNNIVASNVLFWGGLVFPTAVALFETEVLHKGSFLPRIKDLGGGLILLLVLSYTIRVGKAWPKWLLLGMFILGNLLTIIVDRDSLLESLRNDPFFLLTFMTGNITLLWVLVLLFKKQRLQVEQVN